MLMHIKGLIFGVNMTFYKEFKNYIERLDQMISWFETDMECGLTNKKQNVKYETLKAVRDDLRRFIKMYVQEREEKTHECPVCGICRQDGTGCACAPPGYVYPAPITVEEYAMIFEKELKEGMEAPHIPSGKVKKPLGLSDPLYGNAIPRAPEPNLQKLFPRRPFPSPDRTCGKCGQIQTKCICDEKCTNCGETGWTNNLVEDKIFCEHCILDVMPHQKKDGFKLQVCSICKKPIDNVLTRNTQWKRDQKDGKTYNLVCDDCHKKKEKSK